MNRSLFGAVGNLCAAFLALAPSDGRIVPSLRNLELGNGAFDCLASARDFRVRVDLALRGCFGGSDSNVVLERHGRTSSLLAREWTSWGAHRVTGPSAVPHPELDALVMTLVDAATRTPEPPLNRSTNKTLVRINLVCDGVKHGPIEFDASEDVEEAYEGKPEEPWDNHTTATNVLAWAFRIFAAHRDSPVLPDPEDEVARTGRIWGSLYEHGDRVRHDPIEEWEE